MELNAEQLERKISALNDWIRYNDESHREYKEHVHKRNYYVNKLIELEEMGIKTIKV